jgi:hypothetical protein
MNRLSSTKRTIHTVSSQRKQHAGAEKNPVFGGKGLALGSPAKRLCHRSAEVIDKGQDFDLEIGNRDEIAAFEQLAAKNTEPNLGSLDDSGVRHTGGRDPSGLLNRHPNTAIAWYLATPIDFMLV